MTEAAETTGLTRSPLKRGNSYQYPGYSSGFDIKFVAFRGHPEDDGGLQGVAIRWTGFSSRHDAVFIPCKSDAEFFANLLVGNAYDKPVTS